MPLPMPLEYYRHRCSKTRSFRFLPWPSAAPWVALALAFRSPPGKPSSWLSPAWRPEQTGAPTGDERERGTSTGRAWAMLILMLPELRPLSRVASARETRAVRCCLPAGSAAYPLREQHGPGQLPRTTESLLPLAMTTVEQKPVWKRSSLSSSSLSSKEPPSGSWTLLAKWEARGECTREMGRCCGMPNRCCCCYCYCYCCWYCCCCFGSWTEPGTNPQTGRFRRKTSERRASTVCNGRNRNGTGRKKSIRACPR
mmetsp:Transcript_20979/g.58320  ORF Transcript_20979/g.58320 Transcript_20979/m.58320 type:complete len:255 (+) Transcript_20979:814-1578(+)